MHTQELAKHTANRVAKTANPGASIARKSIRVGRNLSLTFLLEFERQSELRTEPCL